MPLYGTSDSHVDTPRIPPRLLALIGERIATLASAIGQPPTVGTALGPGQPTALVTLERLGMQLQQLWRMVEHDGESAAEPIDLQAACRQAAAEWQPSADTARVPLEVVGTPVQADVNTAAVTQTLDLLIEHGLACGARVALGAQRVGAPAQPAVRLDITLRVPTSVAMPAAPAGIDTLLPTLAALLARGTGMRLEHAMTGTTLTLWLVIPPPLRAMRPSASDGMLPRTPVAVGRRILIVDPNAASRLKACQLLTDAGMLADALENVAQALSAALREAPPDVLISGISTHEPGMARFVDELRAASPTLRVIELVDASDAFALSMPGADAPGRLSRDELEAHLTIAVSEEIDGARPA